MAKIKTYLINLNRSIDRLEVMNNRLNTVGLSYERVSAIDGITLSSEMYKEISPNTRYPHPLTVGEVACFLSHKKCWELFLQSNFEWALILEDNCTLSKSAMQYFTESTWIPPDCKLINFCNREDNTIFSDKQVTLTDGNTLLRVKITPPIGAYAYIISKEAAKNAIEQSEVIYEPVDNFLFGAFSSYASKNAHWRLKGSVIWRCNETKTTIIGRSNHKYSWYSIHPKRLLKKVYIKFKKLTLSKVQHYIFSK